MTARPAYFTNILFIATCLAVGCTSGGNLGCGSDTGASGPTLDTQLLGIYGVDQYQRSGASCDELQDVDPPPSRFALYTVPAADNPDKGVLVGQFCGTVLDCRRRAEDLPQLFSYTFLEGSDSAGWRGWGLPANPEVIGDQCRVEVQTHNLTSKANQAIRIDTRQVDTSYDSTVVEPGSNDVTCSIREAIDSISSDSPCTLVYLLEATFETSL